MICSMRPYQPESVVFVVDTDDDGDVDGTKFAARIHALNNSIGLFVTAKARINPLHRFGLASIKVLLMYSPFTKFPRFLFYPHSVGQSDADAPLPCFRNALTMFQKCTHTISIICAHDYGSRIIVCKWHKRYVHGINLHCGFHSLFIRSKLLSIKHGGMKFPTHIWSMRDTCACRLLSWYSCLEGILCSNQACKRKDLHGDSDTHPVVIDSSTRLKELKCSYQTCIDATCSKPPHCTCHCTGLLPLSTSHRVGM